MRQVTFMADPPAEGFKDGDITRVSISFPNAVTKDAALAYIAEHYGKNFRYVAVQETATEPIVMCEEKFRAPQAAPAERQKRVEFGNEEEGDGDGGDGFN